MAGAESCLAEKKGTNRKEKRGNKSKTNLKDTFASIYGECFLFAFVIEAVFHFLFPPKGKSFTFTYYFANKHTQNEKDERKAKNEIQILLPVFTFLQHMMLGQVKNFFSLRFSFANKTENKEIQHEDLNFC